MSARSQLDGFPMLVSIHVAHGVETFLELLAICGETDYGEHDAVVGTDPEDLGIVA